MSLADGLATALRRYHEAKAKHGLEALLLGRVDPSDDSESDPPRHVASQTPQNVSRYKIKCPSCTNELSFSEGCVKCEGCGFSQC